MTGTRERSHLPTIPDSCKQGGFGKDLDPARAGLEEGTGSGGPLLSPSQVRKKRHYLGLFIQKKKSVFKEVTRGGEGKSKHLGVGAGQEGARDFF